MIKEDQDISQIFFDESKYQAYDSDEYYLLDRMIFDSSYFSFYLARKSGKLFIIKALIDRLRDDQLFILLLKKEFEIGFKIDHPNVARVYDYLFFEEIGYGMVMEYIDGDPLSDFIDTSFFNGKLAKKLILQLAEALHCLHKNSILHKDIKLNNILVSRTTKNLKIIDFGLSDSETYTFFKKSAGTKAFASPEQLRGEHIDARADVFSFGRVLFEMNKKLSDREYNRLAKRCMNEDRDRRPSGFDDILLYLQRDKWRLPKLLLFPVAPLLIILIWLSSLLIMRDPHKSEQKEIQKRVAPEIVDSIRSVDVVEQAKPSNDSKSNDSKSNEIQLNNPRLASSQTELLMIRNETYLMIEQFLDSQDWKGMSADSLDIVWKRLYNIINNQYINYPKSKEREESLKWGRRNFEAFSRDRN